MTEMWKNQSEEWTYFTQLFIYFITVNKYQFSISVIGNINMQIIDIVIKKQNIGQSLHKTLNTDIRNYFKMKRYFDWEIKTTSRWQQVTVNKWIIATEPNYLNSWFIQERSTVMLLRDAKQCCGCLELFFVGEIEQKQAIWCLKRNSLIINLFIELLYKINVTFVIMLIF